jgi:hypothetical protein
MKYINIETRHGLVKIQLLSNPFIEKYIPQVQKIHTVFQSEIRSGPWLGYFAGANPGWIKKNTQTLKSAVDGLNQLGLNFPFLVREDSLQTCDETAQDLLNQLHRCFTTANRDSFAGQTTLKWSDRFDSSFTVRKEDFDRMMYLTEIINDTVHNTEPFINTHRKTTDPSQVLRQIELLANVTNDNPFSDLGPYSTLKGWFVDFTDEDYEYFSDSDEFDVWVGRDILGKDFIHAYYDCDDPTNWDVTGSLGYSGKIAIDRGPVTKSSIIKSDQFRKWLDSYGVPYTKKMGAMPLGQVVEGKELLGSIMMPEHDIKVSFE